MITLITGTPGAGKTLYAVSKLLRELVGTSIPRTNPDGTVTQVPRRILTNINGLLLDHVLIGPDEGGGLADWHKWCQPGDVICYDEVQRSWTPRANGSKVPDYIAALETHRHMGVDFILLTQNPMLIDRNVTALVGRHLHVRRFGSVGAAIVYEWDHCSRSLLYSKSIAKQTFRYDKSVFKLYKSAELHTKPKASIPSLAIFAVVALVGAAVVVPVAYNRVAAHSQQTEEALTSKKPETSKPEKKAVVVTQSTEHLTHQIPANLPPPVVEAVAPFPLPSLMYAGAMRFGAKTSFFFRVPASPGVLLQSEHLLKAGYKLQPLDDCMLKVSFGVDSRVFVCDIPQGPKPGGHDSSPLFDAVPRPVDPLQAAYDGGVIKSMYARR